MTTRPTGRRALNRAARHDQLMSAATDIVTEEGLHGLTMQAVAERVGCAVGTIYTYFDSKSALLSALQVSAIQILMASYHEAAEMWEAELAESDLRKRDALASALEMHLDFGRGAGGTLETTEHVRTFLRIRNGGDPQSVAARESAVVLLGFLNDTARLCGRFSSLRQDPAGDGFKRPLQARGHPFLFPRRRKEDVHDAFLQRGLVRRNRLLSFAGPLQRNVPNGEGVVIPSTGPGVRAQ